MGASVDKGWIVGGYVFNGNNALQPLNTCDMANNKYLRCMVSNNSAGEFSNMVRLENHWWTSGTNTAVIVVQYTKTTDTAGSYNIANENDYSTTEKIVGTWNDGSPIYQCDFTDTVPQNTTAGTITNLTLRTLPGCRIMDYKMVFKKASNGNIVTLPAINGNGYRIQLRTSWDGSQGSTILFTEQAVYTTDKIKYTLQYIKTTN